MRWIFSPMLFAAAFTLPAAAQEMQVTIRLKNGGVVDALAVSHDRDSITFKAPGASQSIEMFYAQIDAIQWPEFEEWTKAQQSYDFGRYADAAPLFEKVAGMRGDPKTGYPSPGNYASLAQRRLVECRRRLGDAAGVAKNLGKIETEWLPAADLPLPPVLDAWAAAGREDWAKVMEIGDRLREDVAFSGTSGQGIELAYLSGMALQALDRIPEALIAFAAAYSLNAATDPGVSRMAMERAILLLAADPDREPQLRSLTHLYASNFGKGTLWEGAPEPVVAALSRPMEKGEAALGQAGRTETRGEIAEETGGLKAVEQVTADRMKKVEARPEAVSGKDSSKEANP